MTREWGVSLKNCLRDTYYLENMLPRDGLVIGLFDTASRIKYVVSIGRSGIVTELAGKCNIAVTADLSAAVKIVIKNAFQSFTE